MAKFTTAEIESVDPYTARLMQFGYLPPSIRTKRIFNGIGRFLAGTYHATEATVKYIAPRARKTYNYLAPKIKAEWQVAKPLIKAEWKKARPELIKAGKEIVQTWEETKPQRAQTWKDTKEGIRYAGRVLGTAMVRGATYAQEVYGARIESRDKLADKMANGISYVQTKYRETVAEKAKTRAEREDRRNLVTGLVRDGFLDYDVRSSSRTKWEQQIVRKERVRPLVRSISKIVDYSADADEEVASERKISLVENQIAKQMKYGTPLKSPVELAEQAGFNPYIAYTPKKVNLGKGYNDEPFYRNL